MQAQPISKTQLRAPCSKAGSNPSVKPHQIAKMVPGRAASTVMAERNSGIYRDVIVGHTRDYIIQRIGKQPAAVCREIRSSIISRSQVEHALIGASVSDGLRSAARSHGRINRQVGAETILCIAIGYIWLSRSRCSREKARSLCQGSISAVSTGLQRREGRRR
jgi:hypothetical protein